MPRKSPLFSSITACTVSVFTVMGLVAPNGEAACTCACCAVAVAAVFGCGLGYICP